LPHENISKLGISAFQGASYGRRSGQDTGGAEVYQQRAKRGKVRKTEKESKMCAYRPHGQTALNQRGSAHVHEYEGGSGDHQYNDIESTNGTRLLITLVLNLVIPVAQVIGGVYANSMALVSDAAHNFSDFAAILITYFAHLIGRRGASIRNTFGYRRVEVMAAVINVVILVGACFFIVYEAIVRFQHSQIVIGRVVVWLACVGILGNGFSALLLHRGSKENLNVRGAFLHMIGDFLTSVVVLVNGILLLFRPWYWLDPLLSLVIVLFVLKNCWSILKEATGILMNATPRGMDIQEIRDYLESIPGVLGVHYLHAWNVSSSSIAFSCHVQVADQLVSDTETLAQTIRRDLHDRFAIDHPILQFETVQCGNGGILCEITKGDTSHA
jgi:cobalt-zinc-cadmium efflux system protein